MPDRWRRHPRATAEQSAPQDAVVEAALLAHVLSECPEGAMIPMLALRFSAEFEQGSDGSAVECAIRELVCAGRLQMRGGLLIADQPDLGRAGVGLAAVADD